MFRASWNRALVRKNVFFHEQPKFRDFLATLVTNYSSFDKEWLPICRLCLPCIFRYNYIIKNEYFVEDTRCLIKELGLDKYGNLKLEKKPIDHEMIANYYGEVPLNLLKQLYELYKEDFIFFDYSPEEYYKMSKYR